MNLITLFYKYQLTLLILIIHLIYLILYHLILIIIHLFKI